MMTIWSANRAVRKSQLWQKLCVYKKGFLHKVSIANHFSSALHSCVLSFFMQEKIKGNKHVRTFYDQLLRIFVAKNDSACLANQPL